MYRQNPYQRRETKQADFRQISSINTGANVLEKVKFSRGRRRSTNLYLKVVCMGSFNKISRCSQIFVLRRNNRVFPRPDTDDIVSDIFEIAV